MTKPEGKHPFVSCEQEEIRYTGHIQSHGIIIAVDPIHRIIGLSENVTRLGVDPKLILKKSFLSVFRELKDFESILKNTFIFVPTFLGTLSCGEEKWTATLTLHTEGVFIEFEPLALPLFPQRGGALLHELTDQATDSESSYADLLQLLRDVLNYDHIMVYQFLKDFSGEVVAELQSSGGPHYLGHRFPASDIPKIARDLYAKTLCRVVARSDEELIQVLTIAGHSIDLTHCYLRSVSPVHLEYLRNMGVASSLSLPIMTDDRLWGLISCHNYTQKAPSFQQRMLAVEAVQNFSVTLRTLQIFEENSWRIEADEIFANLLAEIKLSDTEFEISKTAASKLLSFLDLCGITFSVNGRTWSIGDCPDESLISALLKKIGSDQNEPLLASDRCPEEFGDSSDWPPTIGGVLLAGSQWNEERSLWRYAILGYRPEVTQFITWAGKPEKIFTVENEIPRMHPRRSFKAWIEECRGCSKPWANLDRFKIKRTLTWLIECIEG